MIRVHIHEGEWRVYEAEDLDSCKRLPYIPKDPHTVEIPSELWERWLKVRNEFDAVQKELERYRDKQFEENVMAKHREPKR